MGTRATGVSYPHSPFLQVPDHSGGRVQTEGAAAGEDQGVDALHRAHRVQQGGFTGAGSGAAYVHSGHNFPFRQDDGDSRGTPRIDGMSDPDAIDVRQAALIAGGP